MSVGSLISSVAASSPAVGGSFEGGGGSGGGGEGGGGGGGEGGGGGDGVTLRRTLRLLPAALAVIRSTRPSRSRSAAANDRMPLPPGLNGASAVVKPPTPSPSRIVTRASLATARSSLPSPLKSAAAID